MIIKKVLSQDSTVINFTILLTLQVDALKYDWSHHIIAFVVMGIILVNIKWSIVIIVIFKKNNGLVNSYLILICQCTYRITL